MAAVGPVLVGGYGRLRRCSAAGTLLVSRRCVAPHQFPSGTGWHRAMSGPGAESEQNGAAVPTVGEAA